MTKAAAERPVLMIAPWNVVDESAKINEKARPTLHNDATPHETNMRNPITDGSLSQPSSDPATTPRTGELTSFVDPATAAPAASSGGFRAPRTPAVPHGSMSGEGGIVP